MEYNFYLERKEYYNINGVLYIAFSLKLDETEIKTSIKRLLAKNRYIRAGANTE